MPILGFNLTKIEAERLGKISPDMKINSGLKILNAKLNEKANVQAPDVLGIELEYAVSFPDAGMITLTGKTSFIDAENKTKELAENYKKEKKLPSEVKTQIYNHALYVFTIKTLSITQDLGLPPHIRLPYIDPTEQNNSK